MSAGDFDYDTHERLRNRVANMADNVLWTFKQHYTAASFYGYIGLVADIATALLGGILTYTLIWESISWRWMVGMTVVIAIISGFKVASKPQKRAEAHSKAGFAYHKLFDELKDFIELELADKSIGLKTMEERYGELSVNRRKLNNEMPNISSVWYRWLKFSQRLSRSSIYEEIETTEEAKERLTGNAKLVHLAYDDKN